MVSEREREKIKLTANYRNGVAIAFLAVGGLTSGLQLINRPDPDWVNAFGTGFFAIFVSVMLHHSARAALNKLP